MPVFPPRLEPIKKQEQLEKKIKSLETVIRKKLSQEKCIKAAENVRLAQLSLIKAKRHEMSERQFQKKSFDQKLKAFDKEISLLGEQVGNRNY